jgi:hypothetical protein
VKEYNFHRIQKQWTQSYDNFLDLILKISKFYKGKKSFAEIKRWEELSSLFGEIPQQGGFPHHKNYPRTPNDPHQTFSFYMSTLTETMKFIETTLAHYEEKTQDLMNSASFSNPKHTDLIAAKSYSISREPSSLFHQQSLPPPSQRNISTPALPHPPPKPSEFQTIGSRRFLRISRQASPNPLCDSPKPNPQTPSKPPSPTPDPPSPLLEIKRL